MDIVLKILFLSGDTSDYLSISLLHGLKQLENVCVIDYPKSDFLYHDNDKLLRPYLRGNGFTLFFSLDDKPVRRVNLKLDRIMTGKYDLIVFGDIKSNFGLYFEYLPFLNKGSTAVLDGSDSPSLFGDSGEFWRTPYYWSIPRPQNRFLYFKREWIPTEINHSRCFKLLPRQLSGLLPQKPSLRQISFSVPAEKIVRTIPNKTKLLASHIVDDEIRLSYSDCESSGYLFESEEDYYADLRSARFGITTKRAGWDCLRHYEIAANGTVMCFRDLELKPVLCAPHGLMPGVNCISYSSYDDLMSKILNMTEDSYRLLLQESLSWIWQHTTKQAATKFLSHFS